VSGPTLHEALAAAGYKTVPSTHGRKWIVSCRTGFVAFRGCAWDVWEWLRVTRLYDHGREEP
jgi:hypothetical protein